MKPFQKVNHFPGKMIWLTFRDVLSCKEEQFSKEFKTAGQMLPGWIQVLPLDLAHTNWIAWVERIPLKKESRFCDIYCEARSIKLRKRHFPEQKDWRHSKRQRHGSIKIYQTSLLNWWVQIWSSNLCFGHKLWPFKSFYSSRWFSSICNWEIRIK